MTAPDNIPDEQHSYVGRSVRRREDQALVTGRGRYAGDLHPARLLQMSVCRSTVPHGKLLGVDLDAARSMPRVVAAFSAGDLAESQAAIADNVLPEVQSGKNAAKL